MIPIALSGLYLLYLSLICQTLFIYDSIGYEKLGHKIVREGFASYLQGGPEREPLYPLLYSSAVRLGEFFTLDPRWVLKLEQIGLLLLTQVLALMILKRLDIRPWPRTLALLYIGFSPVLVNSTLWVYSEILVLPIILSIVLLCARTWTTAHGNDPSWKLAATGMGLGIILTFSCLVKGIFELIAPLIMLPFIFLAACHWKAKAWGLLKRALIALAFTAAAFYVPLLSYKSANLAANGHFALTDRAGWALYGNTARRVENINARRFSAALVYAANPHACYALLDSESCDFWSYKPSDHFGRAKLQELTGQGIKEREMDRNLITLALRKALENPLQYALLAFLETWKMLFWETSKAGQVMYPDWVEKLYSPPWFEPALVGISAAMSLIALISLIRLCLRQRRQLFSTASNPRTALAFFILVVLLAYAFAHSPFFVLQRYALPLAPLWIIAMTLVFKRSKEA